LKTPAGDIPPTNKAVSMAGAIFVRFNGQGEIEEERRYFDMASMLAQLGVTAGQP
jgi:predicted ester cyclase